MAGNKHAPEGKSEPFHEHVIYLHTKIRIIHKYEGGQHVHGFMVSTVNTNMKGPNKETNKLCGP
jgi:hypothetical protein